MTFDFQPADGPFEKRATDLVGPNVFAPLEAKYREEPRGRWTSDGGVLAKPHNSDQVSQLVALANEMSVAVIPYSGGTGLVGGQINASRVPALVLSLERMNAIREVLPSENVMIVEGGAILADVQAAAAEKNRLFPLSLASEGSARIGGLLGTNAGGVNVLRYGNTREQVLGLEAVLPDGRIWNGMSRLRKDNTGYDLRHMMIGSEGTLGVITAACLRLSPIPADTGTAVLVVKNPQAALDLLTIARDQVGEGISSFELIHRQGLSFLREKLPEVRLPFEDDPEWMVLVEYGLARGIPPAKALEDLFEAGAENGLVLDGVIAQSKAQSDSFWAVRENIPEANRRIGAVSSHDISLPLSIVPEFIESANAAINSLGDFRVNCFGHLGDGNLHFNIFPVAGKTKQDHQDVREAIKRTLHDLVHARGGSVSAEHGIGRLKVQDLKRYADPVGLDLMRTIKKAIDPNGIMNPGVIFESSSQL